MTPEQILSHPPRVLTQQQRELYFEQGYICVEKLIESALLEELRALTQEFIEQSRAVRYSNDVFDLAPEHSAEAPHMRRLKRPDDQSAVFWEYARSTIADVAADLVGPDVLFHHSKLNFKWRGSSDEVQWHQDAQFYPHTNYSPLTIGTYIEDTTLAHGPLAVIPGSHEGPLYDQYNAKGAWVGALSHDDVETLPLDDVVHLEAPAGSITVHNCRTVHGSARSTVSALRPLLLNAYSSADALAYTPHPDPSSHAYALVRGKRAKWAHHDERPCQIPPDWSGGYTSIFAAQSGEDSAASGY